VDLAARGVASSFGAGLFVGLAPAASLAGPWLLVSLAPAVVLGALAVLSTSERPLDTAPVPLRRIGFALSTLGRLAAAVAVAGTFGVYATPARPALGALGLVVVVCAAVIAGVPRVVFRVAAAVVVACLAVVVAACFAIAPVTPAVATPDGGSPLGVLLAAGLLSVCFFGTDPGGGRRRVGAVLVLVGVACFAVAAAALYQLGAARLALSPAPLRDVLAAADASALEPLLVAGVAVACAFTLLGILRGLRVAGIPEVRLVAVAGAATAVGSLFVPPETALAAAAVLLLGDAAFRFVAVRHRGAGR
jgi:APA family basic amino acid/polyamine antiporter